MVTSKKESSRIEKKHAGKSLLCSVDIDNSKQDRRKRVIAGVNGELCINREMVKSPRTSSSMHPEVSKVKSTKTRNKETLSLFFLKTLEKGTDGNKSSKLLSTRHVPLPPELPGHAGLPC